MVQVYKLWKMKRTSSSGILKAIYQNGCYLDRENYNFLKLYRNNSFYSKISASFF